VVLILLGCLFACQEATDPAPSLSEPEVDDFEAVRTRMRQQDLEIAAAYVADNATDIPETVGEVFDRHLEAVGGKEAFDSIDTLVLRFTAQNSSGSFAEMVRYYKKPLHYRQKMSISPRAAVTDGSRVWWVTDDEWELAEGETSYLAVSSMDNHLIDPGALGIEHDLTGVVAVDGEPGFLVRRIWPHGSEDELFFSAASGLLTGMRRESPLTPESWAVYWDYRDVGGVLFPFVHIRTIGDTGPPHGLVLQEAQINVPLPDSLFLPPDER
jgi:hypothetical protein